MISYVYGFRNKLGDFFFTPFYEKQDKKDYIDAFTQSLYQCDRKMLASLNECELYYFGSFDNKTGISILLDKPEYLLSCDTLVKKVPVEIEAEKND